MRTCWNRPKLQQRASCSTTPPLCTVGTAWAERERLTKLYLSSFGQKHKLENTGTDKKQLHWLFHLHKDKTKNTDLISRGLDCRRLTIAETKALADYGTGALSFTLSRKYRQYFDIIHAPAYVDPADDLVTGGLTSFCAFRANLYWVLLICTRGFLGFMGKIKESWKFQKGGSVFNLSCTVCCQHPTQTH